VIVPELGFKKGSFLAFPSDFDSGSLSSTALKLENFSRNSKCREAVLAEVLDSLHRSPKYPTVSCGGPGGPGQLPAQGSHRSGRAHISASGSSTDSFAIRGGPRGYPVELR
jgi:hypothetical protein